MPEQSNNPFNFWQELKRRKVFRVITVYGAAAFVIIELINNITEPLSLPEWVPTLVIVLLAIGFLIAIVMSWIFDITPEGVKKTEPVSKIKEHPEEKPAKMIGWKIATYISIVIIIGFVVLNILSRNKGLQDLAILDKSIAVLPFKNFSTDSGQEHMCMGLTDEIINHLFKIESFDKVASLSSVLTFRDTDKLTPEIAIELDVNYILEGTYKKIGEQLRVTAQLIEAKSDKHLWQNEYDQPYEEIIAIQADIALQIADHLKAYMTESEIQIVQNVYIPDQEAYQLLQKSKSLFYSLVNSQKRGTSREDIDLAIQATLIDPDYAEAYAWAGYGILARGLLWWCESSLQSVAWDALNNFEKALELDQNNMLAHIGLGAMNIFQNWDYVEAEKESLKAIELAPNNVGPYQSYIEFFIQMNQLERAKYLIKKRQELDDSESLSFVTWIHILSGNREEALRAINHRLDSYGYPNIGVGQDYVWLEEYDSAIVHLQSAELTRDRAYLAIAYYKTGQYQQAIDIKNQLISQSRETLIGSPAFFTGKYYSAIGEVDSAFYWLERACENRSPEMAHLKVDPCFNNLKDNERYWDLYERTGHKAYDEYIESMKK